MVFGQALIVERYILSKSNGAKANPLRLCIMLSWNSSKPQVLGGIGEQGELRLPYRVNGISISSNIFIFAAFRIAADVKGYEADDAISRNEGGGPKALGKPPAPRPVTPPPRPYKDAAVVPAKPEPKPLKLVVPSRAFVSKPMGGCVSEVPKGGGTPTPA